MDFHSAKLFSDDFPVIPNIWLRTSWPVAEWWIDGFFMLSAKDPKFYLWAQIVLCEAKIVLPVFILWILPAILLPVFQSLRSCAVLHSANVLTILNNLAQLAAFQTSLLSPSLQTISENKNPWGPKWPPAVLGRGLLTTPPCLRLRIFTRFAEFSFPTVCYP